MFFFDPFVASMPIRQTVRSRCYQALPSRRGFHLSKFRPSQQIVPSAGPPTTSFTEAVEPVCSFFLPNGDLRTVRARVVNLSSLFQFRDRRVELFFLFLRVLSSIRDTPTMAPSFCYWRADRETLALASDKLNQKPRAGERYSSGRRQRAYNPTEHLA